MRGPGQAQLNKGALFRLYKEEIVDRLNFQYNPTEVKRSFSNSFRKTQHPGQVLTGTSFSRFGERPVGFTLMFYGREGEVDVDEIEARLELFTLPGPDFDSDNPSHVTPGRVKLVLGNRVLTGVLEKINVNEKMFDRTLRVQYIEAKVSFIVASRGFESELAYVQSVRRRAGLDG